MSQRLEVDEHGVFSQLGRQMGQVYARERDHDLGHLFSGYACYGVRDDARRGLWAWVMHKFHGGR